MIGFDRGVRGFWNSTANLGKHGTIYGLTIQREQATVCMRTRGEVFVYPGPVIEPENAERAWKKTWIQSWHFTPEHQPAPLSDYLLRGNRTLVRELVISIEHDTERDCEPARRGACYGDHPGCVRVAFRRGENASPSRLLIAGTHLKGRNVSDPLSGSSGRNSRSVRGACLHPHAAAFRRDGTCHHFRMPVAAGGAARWA